MERTDAQRSGARRREPRCYVRCPRCRTWLAETPRERLRLCPHCGFPLEWSRPLPWSRPRR